MENLKLLMMLEKLIIFLIKNETGTVMSMVDYLDIFTQALNETKLSYDLIDFDVNEDNNITFVLLNNEIIDPFQTNKDLWRKGFKFTFSDISFSFQPFFERMLGGNSNIIKKIW